MYNKDIKNSIFGGLDDKAIQQLNASVARPIQLCSEMPVTTPSGRHITVPVATMLAIVSPYDTVLAITDALVPVTIIDKNTNRERRMRRHSQWIKVDNGEGGKKGVPNVRSTNSRMRLAYLDHENLGRARSNARRDMRKVMKSKRIPGGLLDMVTDYRLIRAYRKPMKHNPRQMIQCWEVWKIDEHCCIDNKPGKPPMIDSENALSLEMTLQCPPIFEMMPQGFIQKLMRDLATFLGRDEPFLAETTTAYRYKAYMASPDAAQYNQMFKLEDEMRKESRRAVDKTNTDQVVLEAFDEHVLEEEQKRQEDITEAGENISPAPVRKVFQKGEPRKSFKKTDRKRTEDTRPVASVEPSWGFGLQAEDITKQEVPEEASTDSTVDDSEKSGSFGSPSTGREIEDLQAAHVAAVQERDKLMLAALEEDSDDRPSSHGW